MMDQAQQLRDMVKQKNHKPAARARVITVTSGKGGVGKTNTAVNLAVQLRRQGKRVIILDGDFGLANVEVMFGAVPKYDLSDMIYHGRGIREIITAGPMGIGFISAGTGIPGVNNLGRERISALIHSIRELDQVADVVLVDTGDGISDSVLEFAAASPEVLLVITPEPGSLADSCSLMMALQRDPDFDRKEATIRVVVNKVPNGIDGYQVFEKFKKLVQEFFRGELLYQGMIPKDHAMYRAVLKQSPVSIASPMARSSRAYEELAAHLLGGQKATGKGPNGIESLFSNLIVRKA